MCKPSISGAADGYYRLNPGGVCAEPQAGRMCEAHPVKFSRDTSGPSRALLGPAVPKVAIPCAAAAQLHTV